MTTVTYTQGQVPNCPQCGKPMEDAIEDYVIPGKLGHASAADDSCGWCDAHFRVERTSELDYTLTLKD